MDDPKEIAKQLADRLPDATGGEVKIAARALFGPTPFASKVIGCWAYETWTRRHA